MASTVQTPPPAPPMRPVRPPRSFAGPVVLIIIGILGLAWLGDTFMDANSEVIIGGLKHMATAAPPHASWIDSANGDGRPGTLRVYRRRHPGAAYARAR